MLGSGRTETDRHADTSIWQASSESEKTFLCNRKIVMTMRSHSHACLTAVTPEDKDMRISESCSLALLCYGENRDAGPVTRVVRAMEKSHFLLLCFLKVFFFFFSLVLV